MKDVDLEFIACDSAKEACEGARVLILLLYVLLVSFTQLLLKMTGSKKVFISVA